MLRFRLSLALLAATLLIACGGAPPDSPTTPKGDNGETPPYRYVNSGWVNPKTMGEWQAFSEELRVFVITDQAELDAFQQGFTAKRSWGNTTTLARIDFPNSILLAAYYLYRPFQGDPLSVVGFSFEGRRAEVLLELEESPQGREYPYLLAPMIMVAVDRTQFPSGEAVDFVFHLNGEAQATVAATVE